MDPRGARWAAGLGPGDAAQSRRFPRVQKLRFTPPSREPSRVGGGIAELGESLGQLAVCCFKVIDAEESLPEDRILGLSKEPWSEDVASGAPTGVCESWIVFPGLRYRGP